MFFKWVPISTGNYNNVVSLPEQTHSRTITVVPVSTFYDDVVCVPTRDREGSEIREFVVHVEIFIDRINNDNCAWVIIIIRKTRTITSISTMKHARTLNYQSLYELTTV